MEETIITINGTNQIIVPPNNNANCPSCDEQLSNHAHSDLIGVQAKQCHTMCDNAACQGGDSSLEPPQSCDATTSKKRICRKKSTDYKTEAKVYISLRTTSDTKLRITEQANLLNLSESEYVRRAVLSALAIGDKLFDDKTGRKIYIVDEKLRQELNRIGNNINQIAYALNVANLNNDNVSLADVFEQLVKFTTELETLKTSISKEAENVL